MGVQVSVVSPGEVEADVVAVPVAEPGEAVVEDSALDERLHRRIAELAAAGEVDGQLGEAPILHVEDGATPRVAAAGIGRRGGIDGDTLRTAAGAVARAAGRVGGTVAWLLGPGLELPPAEQARAIVDGTVLGAYEPGRWKTNGRRPKPIERIVLVGSGEGVEEAASRAARVAEWANRARDLANAPPNELTPDGLADRAAEVAAGGSPQLSVEAPNLEEIRELGMGAFAAVAQGSHNPARLIVARYEPSQPKGEVVLGLVGKAVTFDTGGISLKKPAYMEDMKGDMAGGGAVIAALGALAELECPLRVIGVVGATENAVGGGAYRPGDILTAMNGKTIEIINTDAEGRLVLADVLAYARQLGTTHLVDFATLTGAMERALGDFYAGVFANDTDWRTLVVESGEASGDHAWPWPLHSRYRRYVDSDYADMKNSNIRSQGVPVLAAEFLHEFAGEGPWAHVDMAGTGFFTWPRHDYLWQRGGTGYGVRLICELADRLAAAD
ncbi:MAG: leucyl aminopeptidase family protein [Actinobacteria bacterium]|nr:MAG: leucyl aminopeptidase family protein [Actinomycetota bacterium]